MAKLIFKFRWSVSEVHVLILNKMLSKQFEIVYTKTYSIGNKQFRDPLSVQENRNKDLPSAVQCGRGQPGGSGCSQPLY